MDDILYRVEEGIATITLNRPDKHNAFTLAMVGTWAGFLRQAQADPEVRVVVITAQGKSFCSGGDVAHMDTSHQTPLSRKEDLTEHVHRIPLALEEMDKVVICAINGAAVGAGMDLTLGCDFRIASESARFSEAYVRVGLVPGAGGGYFLPRLVGPTKALELLITGAWIDASEAKRIGLVNEVVADDQLMRYTYDLARKIAAGPSLAQRLIKRIVRQSLDLNLRSHLDLVSSHMAVVAFTEDHAEGIKAFAEKRQPQFRGR